MTYKQKLIELLKTNEEVKKDLEELREGCIVNDTDYNTGLAKISIINGRSCIMNRFNDLTKNWIERKTDVEDWEIIGNPLDYHHLMIYCESKGYAFAVGSQGKLIGNRNESGSYTEIQLDNTKSFDNQSEEVYEKIFNFLNENV